MANLTITVPDAELPRIQAAFGQFLGTQTAGVPRPATAGEIRAWIISQCINVVKGVEENTAFDTAHATARAAVAVAPAIT